MAPNPAHPSSSSSSTSSPPADRSLARPIGRPDSARRHGDGHDHDDGDGHDHDDGDGDGDGHGHGDINGRPSSLPVAHAGQKPDLEPASPPDVADSPDSPDEIDAVYRKLDRRILPALWVLYFLCSAIRSNIGIAQTMNADVGHDLVSVLHLSPRDTSTALALFYVSYVLFDLPSNLVMSRLSARVWMARIVVATGVVGACLAAARAAWSLDLLRFLLGAVAAGMWPGMAYYLSLFYPPERTARRIGIYFTAAQVSAAVVGLVSAAFQLIDGAGGLTGFQSMFLVYGLVAVAVGISLLWWLPDRPRDPPSQAPPSQLPAPQTPPSELEGQGEKRSRWRRLLPRTPEALTGRDADVHRRDLRRRAHHRPGRAWTVRDLGRVLLDWRIWPLFCMYFGVVGVGIGIQLYGSVIIASIKPDATDIVVSLLFAPIWMLDLIAILIVTPIADRHHRARPLLFSLSVLVQIAGLLLVALAPPSRPWARYAGLLVVGIGLGPTVPICMAWTSAVFQRRHGEVGVAAATALVSGLGNLGSITTTYALYGGWPADAARGYRGSTFVMVAILAVSAASSLVMWALLKLFASERSGTIATQEGGEPEAENDGVAAARMAYRGGGTTDDRP